MECLETVDGPTIWEDHFFPKSSTRTTVRRWKMAIGELLLPP